jgi:hypothetical protein
MSGPVSGPAAKGEALRADLRPSGSAPRPFSHPDPPPSAVEHRGRSGASR